MTAKRDMSVLQYNTVSELPTDAKIGLFGAGGFCLHLIKRLAVERPDIVIPFVADSFKNGEKEGIEIISPDSLAGENKVAFDIILITTEPESHLPIIGLLEGMAITNIAIASEDLRRYCSVNNYNEGLVQHEFNGEVKLNLGGGRKWRRKGWANIDYGIDGYDLGCHLLTPFKDNAIEIIYSSHFLEHVKVEECYMLLKEIHRVLKPKGTVRVSVPDCERYVKAYWNKDDRANLGVAGDRAFMETLINFGGNPEGLHLKSNHGHFFFWDTYTLTWLFLMAGFRDVHESQYGMSSIEELNVPATVVQGYPVDGFDCQDLVPLSIYIEAHK